MRTWILQSVAIIIAGIVGRAQINPSNEDSWDLVNEVGIMRGQILRLSKIETKHAWQSCYNATCIGNSCPQDGKSNTISFCYPSIVIVGVPRFRYDFEI